MEINRELIEHVAKIARLELTEDEINRFIPQLKEALIYFSKLQEIDTENVKPSFHPVDIKNIMREDEEGECLSAEQALSLSLHKKDGYFKGPKVVKKNEE